MDSTLNKKSELEELLATSPISNGELVDEDNSKVLLDLLEVMPKVDLEVQHNESLLAAEGYAVATYRFYQAGAKQTVWLDDDTICLVGTSLTDQTHSTLLCTPRNDAKIITPLAYSAGETPYEVFEYTEQPLLDTCGKILIGRIKVALPSYGGTFRLQYVRTVKLPTAHRTTEQTGTTNLAFTEHRILLAESELLSLRFPIYNAPPDKLVKGVSTIRRRSTAEIISNRVGNILLENMKSISTIYANFLIPGADNVNDNVNSNHFISRVMAWVYDVAEDETSSKETELVIEFDVVKYNSRFISKQTKYSRCRFESPCRFLVAQAYGELVESGRIVLRLPYEAVTSSENRPIQKNYEGEVVVRCSFCCNNLTSSKTIQRIRNLPSGIFDTVRFTVNCKPRIVNVLFPFILTINYCFYSIDDA